MKFRHRSSNDIIACSFLARNHPLRWFQFRRSSNDRLNNTCEVSYDRHSAAYNNEIKVLYHYIKPVRLNENLLESVIGFPKDFSNVVWFPVFCLIAGQRWWWLWRGGGWARGRWRWWRRRWWHRQMISFTSSVCLYQLSFSVNTLYKVV